MLLRDRIREASERIADPATIEARLDGLSGDQSSLLMKLYRDSRSGLTDNEMAQRAELRAMFKATAQDVEADVFKAFADMGGDSWDLNFVRRIGRDKQLLDQINNRIQMLGGEIESSLRDGLIDQFKTTWLDSSYRLDVLTPDSTEIKFGLMPDAEIAQMLDQSWGGGTFSDRLGLITDDMAHNIQQQITRSMMAGEGWQDTARRIRGEMGTTGQSSVWRAEMIARTELSHAQTMANAELYEQNADVIEDVVWVAHPGACVECMAKHGQPISEVGKPPEDSHPNCVCDILAVPKSWGGLAKTEDGDFSLKPPPRTAWAKDNGMASVLE